MVKKVNTDLGRNFLLYGLSFLLLLEWLFPLPIISDTGFIELIFIVTALFFIVTFLQLPVWLSVIIKTLLIFMSISFIFYEGDIFSIAWIPLFMKNILANMSLLFQGDWYAFTDEFRTFLFFVLIAIMSYLLFYWTVQVRRIMFFLFFTVVYVAIIDTFTEYDATYAIIRTFVIGFLLLGLVTIYRRIEIETMHSPPRFLPVRLAALLVMMIVGGGIFGFLSPKPEPQWADPVPFVRAAIGMDNDSPLNDHRKIGYGDNDEQLGGGFQDDDTPVFYAAATEDHYWRGDTKDYYTGKGWKTSTPEVPRNDSSSNQVDSDSLFEAEVVFAEGGTPFSHLLYPGRILADETIMDVNLSLDYYSDKAETYTDEAPVNLSHYQFEYELPFYDLGKLRQSSENDPEDIASYYTQLPDDLPERVTELAEELMEDADNRYDRAKAIEEYLSSSKFKYETTNVPIPGEDDDYVDQFLFVSKQGYCDNFSTSMVVLLRSQNIPARWAKGFTQGEKIETLDEDRYIYQVTNANAHSWVEVYFPEYGWVPFEPTRGFDYAYEAVEDTDVVGAAQEDEDKKEEDESVANEKEDTNTFGGSFFAKSFEGKGIFMLIILAVILALYLGLRNKKVVQYLTLRRFRKRSDEAAFIPAYEQLLWLLSYIGYDRKSGETLREYALRIDEHFSTTEMKVLTKEYEQVTYGGKPVHSSWDLQKDNWETFMQKIHS